MEAIVRAIVVNDGKMLLCKNLKHGHYFLPGGHTEEDESPDDTLKREFAEEIGRVPVRMKMVAEVKNSFEQDGVRVNEMFYVYLAALDRYDGIVSREDHIGFEWVPIPELASISFKPQNVVADIRQAIKDNQEFWK